MEVSHVASHEEPDEENIKQWSSRDTYDVQRLGSMMGGFLAIEPFASEKVFSEQVTAHIRGKAGPRFGAVRRLQYLMSEVDGEARVSQQVEVGS